MLLRIATPKCIFLTCSQTRGNMWISCQLSGYIFNPLRNQLLQHFCICGGACSFPGWCWRAAEIKQHTKTYKASDSFIRASQRCATPRWNLVPIHRLCSTLRGKAGGQAFLPRFHRLGTWIYLDALGTSNHWLTDAYEGWRNVKEWRRAKFVLLIYCVLLALLSLAIVYQGNYANKKVYNYSTLNNNVYYILLQICAVIYTCTVYTVGTHASFWSNTSQALMLAICFMRLPSQADIFSFPSRFSRRSSKVLSGVLSEEKKFPIFFPFCFCFRSKRSRFQLRRTDKIWSSQAFIKQPGKVTFRECPNLAVLSHEMSWLAFDWISASKNKLYR